MGHKTKGLRIATRCSTLDQFVAAFHQFCDANTVFISTLNPREVGIETAFSIDLVDRSAALRGLGIVLESWATAQNLYGRPGLLLGIRKLATDSEPVFDRLLFAREATAATPTSMSSLAPAIIVEESVAKPLPTSPPPTEERTPGSDLILPANPLMNISDASLDGFVDCTLYEETGTFFPEQPVIEDPGDPVAAPPLLAPRRSTPVAMPAITVPTTVPAIVEASGVKASGSTPPATHAIHKQVGPLGIAKPMPTKPVIAPPSTIPTIPVRARNAATPPPSPTVAPRASTEAPELIEEIESTIEPEVEPAPVAVVATPVAPVAPVVADEPPAPMSLPRALSSPVEEPRNAFRRPPSLDELELQPHGDLPTPELKRTTPLPFIAPVYPAYDQQAHASAGYNAVQAPPPELRVSNAFPVQSYREVQARWRRRRLVIAGSAIATALLAIVIGIATHTRPTEAAPAPTPTAVTTAPPLQLVAANTERTPLPPLSAPSAVPEKAVADTTATEPEPAPEASSAAQIIGKGPCKIAISSTPAGSMISVDGESVGPSPLTIAGPCTSRRIDLTHPRYAPAQRVLVPKASETVDVTLMRPTHSLFIDTQPAGAIISIDGHRAGTSPTMVKIMGFTTLTITVEKPGFKPTTKKLYSKSALDRIAVKLVR